MSYLPQISNIDQMDNILETLPEQSRFEEIGSVYDEDPSYAVANEPETVNVSDAITEEVLSIF